MIRKFLMIGAATAMPLGFLAATGGIAGAKTLPIDVSTDHVTCTAVTGSAKFSPALQGSGPFSAETTSIKLSLAGCTISGPVATTGITVTGKGGGTLHSATNSALALAGTNAVTGSITISWKAVGGKISAKSSVVTPSSLSGAPQGDGFASFSLDPGSAAVSGDFAGADSGAASNLYVETVQTTTGLAAELAPGGTPAKPKPSKGIKAIGLTGGNPGETTPTQLTLS
jgi:hypothetical protein